MAGPLESKARSSTEPGNRYPNPELFLQDTSFGPRLRVAGTFSSLAQFYLWLHHNPKYENPVTMGPVDVVGWDDTWDESYRGSLWYFDTRITIPGGWDLRWRKVLDNDGEKRWEIRWGFSIAQESSWYGFTSILDLDPDFSNRWHDGNVYATSGGGWPDTCTLGDNPGRGDHIEGFSWVELSDDFVKFQRGPITFPQEWHHPDLVQTSADLLVDINCVRTIELGWFTGEFRKYYNLSPVTSPLYFQGTELLRVGWWESEVPLPDGSVVAEPAVARDQARA